MVSVLFHLAAFAMQPNPAMLRQLFEQELARTRTAQAARDLGLFLARQGDQAGARAALTEAVHLGGELGDMAELAAVSEPAEAELLWRRASASPDFRISARSFAALALLCEKKGDRAAAMMHYRMALRKEKDEMRVASLLNSLALLTEPAEALPLLERALRIATSHRGHGLEAASIQLNLASRLLGSGRLRRARLLAKEAALTFEELLGPEHPRTVAAKQLLSAAL